MKWRNCSEVDGLEFFLNGVSAVGCAVFDDILCYGILVINGLSEFCCYVPC